MSRLNHKYQGRVIVNDITIASSYDVNIPKFLRTERDTDLEDGENWELSNSLAIEVYQSVENTNEDINWTNPDE